MKQTIETLMQDIKDKKDALLVEKDDLELCKKWIKKCEDDLLDLEHELSKLQGNEKEHDDEQDNF